ncbi:MAG TPA: tripartite tricarboxylate transporter substrate binding protein [Burkholderiaceae bacterium]
MKSISSLTRRQLVAAATLTALVPLRARAQSYPTKPLRVVVAGPAGANADIVARLVTEPLAKVLGQTAIVEPKPGAAGAIAVNDLLQSPHDGHTLLVAVNALVSEIPHIVKLKVDMAQSITPLAELARGGLVLVANPSFPAKNLAELISYVKANPGKVNVASYSAGTLSHVLGLLLNQTAGIDLMHVGYKGSTPALADVMGNHVPLMFDGIPTALPLIKGGKIKAFAVSTPKRSPLLPDVPTFTELGYPKLEALAWMGLWCTPDVPAPVQARVRDATLKVLSQPTVRERLLELGFDVGAPRSTDDMVAGLKADSQRVGAMLQSIGFKPE